MTATVLHIAVTSMAVCYVLIAMTGLRQHRSPQAAFAWLLFTALAPYLGVPAFLALGHRKLPAGERLPASPAAPLPEGRPALMAAFDRLAANAGLPPASGGSRFGLLTDGESAWREIERLTSQARDTLDLVFYKWADDAVGRTLAEMVEARARQGVRVRVLLDGYGSRNRPRLALARLAGAGGQVRVFAPFAGNPFHWRLNWRNHRKMAIADGLRAFSGGLNVATEYMGPHPDPARWTDLAYAVEGPAAAMHARIFEADWRRSGGQAMATGAAPSCIAMGDAAVGLLPSGPDVRDDVLHDCLVLACHRANASIDIVTPYFLPSPVLADALSVAARRGVRVRIVVPARSNQRLADLARASFLREMREAGVRVLAAPTMVHAKAAIFEECAFVGSANFDIRGLFINFETMAVLHSTAERRAVADWAETIAGRCAPWRPDKGLTARLSETIFRLGAPLM